MSSIKDLISRLNPAFDQRNRMGIMSILTTNDWVEYNTMKELLALTDGNLASHLRPLENAEYILIRKEFIGKIPRTTYSSTEKGRTAFSEHITALEQLLRISRED